MVKSLGNLFRARLTVPLRKNHQASDPLRTRRLRSTAELKRRVSSIKPKPGKQRAERKNRGRVRDRQQESGKRGANAGHLSLISTGQRPDRASIRDSQARAAVASDPTASGKAAADMASAKTAMPVTATSA